MLRYTMTIGGEAVSATNTFKVINPANGQLVAECPEGTTALVDRAVAAAKSAFKSWSGLSDQERGEKVLALADILEKHHSELAELITREQGKPQSGPGANLEAGGTVAWTRATAGLSIPDQLLQDDKSGKIQISRKPLGVVASITPWNWPMMIAAWHVMPALRVGCTVVIKPSPFTPLSTLRMVQLCNTLLPPGVLNVVTGGAEVGAYLASHRDVAKVVFTGSVAAGQRIFRDAASTLKRLTLELGGNDAGIVLPGTRIEPLLERLFWGCFINSGQTCAALKRLYVHEDQYEEVVRQFSQYVGTIPVGDGLDPKNLIGPITNKRQYDRVVDLVREARERGARIVAGGDPAVCAGYFYPLTVIADATDDMRIVKEEQFGPAIPILKYSTIDEAMTRANSLNVGLGGSIWGNDPQEAARYAHRLECGTAWVNQHGTLHPLAPFGGVKNSGIGVEFNVDGLKEYTSIQVVNIAY